VISVEEFTDQAAQWLREHGEPKMATDDGDLVRGEGEFSVAVFHPDRGVVNWPTVRSLKRADKWFRTGRRGHGSRADR
jgi:hypothetical protein